MILNALALKLKRQARSDFKGRHFEATLIVQAVSWYLRYALRVRPRSHTERAMRRMRIMTEAA